MNDLNATPDPAHAMHPRASTPQLVHESETQRQHVRVRAPGVLELDAPQGRVRARLHDLSAGGLGFTAPELALRAGQRCRAHLHLALESVTLALPLNFEVRHFDAASGRGGARFEALDAATVASLRRIVGALLAGEMVGVGEVLHAVSRQNLTPPRAAPAPRAPASRARALARTGAMLVVGALALGYIGQRVYDAAFAANATAARVSGPRFQVEMPRDGVFHSLVPADGVVKKGSPVGSFQTSLSELIQSSALQARLSPAEIAALIGEDVKGTLTSPCDCRVLAQYAVDGQYLAKGRRVVDLAPLEFEPYVVARFDQDKAANLQPGTPVRVRIHGEALSRRAQVAQLRHDDDPDALGDSVVVVLKPEQPLPMALLSRPAQVSAGSPAWWNDAQPLATAQASAP